jgi:hypothetical protein
MPLFFAQLDAQRRYIQFWRDMTQAMLLPLHSMQRDLMQTAAEQVGKRASRFAG